MLVNLKRPFFVKGYKLFKPAKFGTEIPDELQSQLPRDAEIRTPPQQQSGKAAKRPHSQAATPPAVDQPPLPPEEEPVTLSALAKKNAEVDEETWTKAKSK